ncbi:MAG: RrF2 family transcriptional regulator [Planctomycetota bacterium]|jgi:Rrf2 family protein
MAQILKVSDAASLALHTMTLLAVEPNRLRSTKEIAYRLQISEAHLAKVLQRLSKAGLVHSVRGPKGGFRLEKPADAVTLLDVYESMEGTLISEDCLFGDAVCTGQCILGDLMGTLNNQVRKYMAGTRLSDLSGVFRRHHENAKADY